jgi:hypothetical protein
MSVSTTSPSRKSSLSQALTQNFAAVQDAQSSYQQDVFNVCQTMASVKNSKLPILNNTPYNWKAVETAYQQAKEDAQAWTNQVYGQLQQTPEDVAFYNDVISAVLDDAISQAQTLIQTPSDATAKKVLIADLKTLESKFKLVNVIISGCQTTFNQFGYTTLPDAATKLITVSNDAYQDHDIDENQIKDFQNAIRDLNEEILKLQLAIGLTAGAIALEVSIGAAFAVETFGLDFILIGIAIAFESAVITLSTIELVKCQNKLKILHAEMDSWTQDAAALKKTGDDYKQLADQTTALGASVDGISSAWSAVERDMTIAIDEVATAITDASFDDYQSVYDDLVDAQKAWNNTYADTQLLTVNVQGNPATLSIGMTSDQVAKEVKNNTSVDFVTYINNIPG